MYAPGALWTAAHHQHSAAAGDAEQSRLSPGSDAHPAHGQPPPARHHQRGDRHDHHRSEHRFRVAGPEHGVVCRWSDHRSQRRSVLRSSAPSSASSAANRHCSMSSRNRARGAIMRLSILMIVIAAVSAVSLSAQTPAAPAGKAPAGNADNGKKIYASYGCYQCHNYAANGGGAGPRLAPNPIAFARLHAADPEAERTKCRPTRRRWCPIRTSPISTLSCRRCARARGRQHSDPEALALKGESRARASHSHPVGIWLLGYFGRARFPADSTERQSRSRAARPHPHPDHPETDPVRAVKPDPTILMTGAAGNLGSCWPVTSFTAATRCG